MSYYYLSNKWKEIESKLYMCYVMRKRYKKVRCAVKTTEKYVGAHHNYKVLYYICFTYIKNIMIHTSPSVRRMNLPTGGQLHYYSSSYIPRQYCSPPGPWFVHYVFNRTHTEVVLPPNFSQRVRDKRRQTVRAWEEARAGVDKITADSLGHVPSAEPASKSGWRVVSQFVRLMTHSGWRVVSQFVRLMMHSGVLACSQFVLLLWRTDGMYAGSITNIW
jgi:hypothetical protein